MTKSVLLVEDNRINQIVTRQMLRSFGVECEIAGSGHHALEVLSRSRFDLVLMDIQLPGMDGIETTRTIRSLDSTVLDHNVPVIAITAYSSREDKTRCLESGMTDYISKPLRLDELQDKVRTYLGNPTPEPGVSDRELKGSPEMNPSSEAASARPGSGRAGTDPVLDRDELMARIGNDSEMASEILRRFLVQLESWRQEILNAVQQGNPEEIHRKAHRLVGTAGNISATALRNTVKRIEQAGRDGRVEDARKTVPDLETEIHRIRARLQAEGITS